MPRPFGRPIYGGATNRRHTVERIRADRRAVNQAEIVITGVEELDAKLRRLPRAMALKAGRRAITIGLKITQKAIQSEIRPKIINRLTKGRKVKRKGGRGFARVGRKFVRKVRERTRLKRTIGYRFARETRKGRIVAKCGVHVGKKQAARQKANYAWFAHFLALGTVERARKKIGGFYGRRFGKRSPSDFQRRTGQVTGDDFVGRGERKSRRSVERAIRGVVEHEIHQFWKDSVK